MISSPGSLRTKLFLAFAMVTLIAAALPAVLTRNTLYSDRMDLAAREALAQAVLAKSVFDSSPAEAQVQEVFRAARELSYRITITDAAGIVVGDSHFESPRLPELDNHGDRPEIEQALAQGRGVSLRHSNSLGMDAVYAAVALRNGGTLRIAVPATEIRRSLETEFSFLGAVVAVVVVFCLLLTALITRYVQKAMGNMAEVVASIPEGKGFRRLREVPGREFLPLARAVNSMADTIEEYVRTTGDQHGQLESILESMHEGVLVLNPAGQIRRWNRALQAMFPHIGAYDGKAVIEGIPIPALQTCVDELLNRESLEEGGRRTAAGVSPGTVESGQAERPEHAFHDGPDPARAVQFELPPGRFLVAHLTRPLHSRESLGVIIVIYDATEIMRLGAMRRDFVSNVSHELRTPLTAIAGYSEVLMTADDLPEDRRAFASIIHNHAAALSKIISDLLMLSRIENDQESIETGPVDARTAFEDAAASCREQAQAKSLRFAADFDHTPVRANSSLLAQVFRNLLENACRYAPEGGAVTVSSARQGREVLFVVADNGPGIPKEALPRIFERFYQVKEERNSGTSGIGLAICKHIIERHGGRVWAESPYENADTAILFTLPLVD